MSRCFFISSNMPLKEVDTRSIVVNLSKLSESDISIYKMSYYDDIYSGKKYANEIEYYNVCDKQVQQIFDYIVDVMIKADEVELWSVLLPEYGVPKIKTKEISIENLSFEYLYNYLLELEKAPYFTEVLNKDDEENSIYYKLRIYK